MSSIHWHQGAGAAEVEVDQETSKIEVTGFHAATYAGQVINPTMASLQTEGNVIMGLGLSLFEEMIYDRGQTVNANLGDYLIPSILDVPVKLSTGEMEHPGGDAELHGIAESTIPVVAPAIANGVTRATGARLYRLPLKAEDVLKQMGAARRD